MKFTQLYSSSRGNLYTVTANSGERLLIECGVRWPKLLEALNYDLKGIVGCLLTHEHKDHSKAIKEVIKAGIDVYASVGTLEACGVEEEHRALPLDGFDRIVKNGFDVTFFRSNHDAADPLYFVVRCDNESLLFATDTSHIKERFRTAFKTIAIECSYDKAILQERVDTGDINEALAKRLLTSHMEKSTTIRYLSEFCDLSKCEEIHLLHLSGENIEREQTRKEIEDRFFITTRTVKDGKSESTVHVQ